ncbi:MAG: dipeptide/oligopeptide/nickel ABC transporter ATP-binding protein [Treponema sp.]|nr:dipeptide/oligopeptide/nickel ABC transporter ATP-binding protein [Treponema sp.]MCL2272030.1 dipeptide/oligopeptide/nickel ABC transporter ATP-binding protein [Treponema sp.]
MSEPLLSVRNLSNSYISIKNSPFGKAERKKVLNNVSLEMKAGEIFGLTGKSGCGKTTLANCILGLTGFEGEILLNGKKCRRGHVQIVFQDPGGSLNPVKKIGFLVEEPLIINKKGNAAERRQAVDRMLIRVGLDPSFKTRRTGELSGGQKQRVCIARALIMQPRLLIADEAISSLDVSAAAQILNLFNKLNKSADLGIIFISHNLSALEYLCNRIAVMENGSIESYLE